MFDISKKLKKADAAPLLMTDGVVNCDTLKCPMSGYDPYASLMRADLLVALITVIYLLGYFLYSSFLAKKIFKLDDNKKTPAHELEDGNDFVPTRKWILFGHHYASIAGVAPIIGPCIAVYWGWLPALTWVVLGNIFMGAVHDMGILLLSVRNKAQSLAEVAGQFLPKKSKIALLFIIVFLLWIVTAAFSVVIARLFVTYPSSVLPTIIASILALIMGQILYRSKLHALVPSLIALALLYASIPLGVKYPIDLTLWFEPGIATAIWVLVLLIYAFIASVLPVWVLLQPRDYINSHQIIVGLGILVIGIFVTKPEMVAPMINFEAERSWFPFLFITVACGAISGAHGLVASGTTAKQINKESDIRPIAYGGMLLEGFLALLAVIAASAGFANNEGWCEHYGSWAHASRHGLDAFVQGSVSFMTHFNLGPEIAAAFIAVIIISFAATSLDTLFRIQRYMLEEISVLVKFKPLGNRYIASLLAVATVSMMVYSDGITKVEGAFTLWPLFGTTNQLLASLALMILALFLMELGSNNLYVLIPGIILTILTMIANTMGVMDFWRDANYLLAAFAVLVLFLQLYIVKDISRSLLKK